MDISNIYRNRSDEGRHLIEGKEIGEPMEEDDDVEKRAQIGDRCQRRAVRKQGCNCGRARPRRRGRRRIASQNPFIIFYLEMYYKYPGQRVTEVARQAGKEWCALPDEDRQKYVRLAERERKRRRGGRTRR